MADFLLDGRPPDPTPQTKIVYGGHSTVRLKLPAPLPQTVAGNVKIAQPGAMYYHRAWDQGAGRWVAWTRSHIDLSPDLASTTPPATGPLIGIKVESVNRS